MSTLRKYDGNIKKMFDNFSPAGLAQQTIAIDETKEEFLQMLNDEFAGNGLYFELHEKQFEFKGFIPTLEIPDINLKYFGRSDRIGYLDPKTKSFVHFCEHNVEQIQEQMIHIKRSILATQQQAKSLEDEIRSKRWNIFIHFFKKRTIKRLEVEGRRLLSEVEDFKNKLYNKQAELEIESEIRDNVLEICTQMRNFEINIHAV